jgi:two-component system response regulator YesN
MTGLALPDIAAAVHMNGSYLTKMFKQKTGISVMDYVIKYRVDMAVQHLKNSNRPVSEIASLVGFLDAKHFSKTFKRRMGLSPRQYRKQLEEASYKLP